MRKTLSRVLGVGEAAGGPRAVGGAAQGAALWGGTAGGGPAGRTKSSPLPGVSGLRNVRPRVPGEPPCRHPLSPQECTQALTCATLCPCWHTCTRPHHVPGNVCPNIRACGAYPQVRTHQRQAHAHPLSLPTTSCFRAASPISQLEGLKVTGSRAGRRAKGHPARCRLDKPCWATGGCALFGRSGSQSRAELHPRGLDHGQRACTAWPAGGGCPSCLQGGQGARARASERLWRTLVLSLPGNHLQWSVCLRGAARGRGNPTPSGPQFPSCNWRGGGWAV